GWRRPPSLAESPRQQRDLRQHDIRGAETHAARRRVRLGIHPCNWQHVLGRWIEWMPSIHDGRGTNNREVGVVIPTMLAYGLANLLGYARDASVAAVFGASTITDAYFVGTFVPVLVSTVLVYGSLVP